MNYLYIAPWIVWALWFIVWEAWGFRKANDHWPTLSQVIKGWEDRKQVRAVGSPIPTQVVEKRGVVNWTWRRWLVAIGLPVLAVVLELHWVWEIR